jgi:hypothetical protein
MSEQLDVLEVRVVRSARRRKTAQARMVGPVLEVRIPGSSTAAEERELVEHFRGRFERKRAAEAVDLEDRAAALADRYGLPRPRSIRWVANQQHRWGSCTPADGTVRLSDRMAGFPGWVVDYVIVHELAHLAEPTHGRAFWELVDRYPRTERARGYLMAKSGC